jgi:hypothetical protein
MNAVIELENMGLSMRLADGGGVTLEGLKRLSLDQREAALAMARAQKAAIVEELRRRANLATPAANQCLAFCSLYWRGCFSCEDFHVGRLKFCARQNGKNEEMIQ